MFDKSNGLFPIKDQYVFLSHCGIAPLYSRALLKERELAELHNRTGALVHGRYRATLDDLHQAAATLLRTSPDNIAWVRNTSEGIGFIANGYPFQPGDQIISYVHEYPANHYPWRLQERRGVELVLLPNRDSTGRVPEGLPVGWTMQDLEQRVSPRTRVVALSHVQFTSGHAANLQVLAEFCRAQDIDLVVDVAQSLGCLPVYPEEWHIAAVVASGWKWLLGPLGTGLLYTSESLRRKLDLVMVGAETMQQGTDYLNHAWNPHHSARCFEYSTVPLPLVAALECCLRELPLRYGVEAISAEVGRLHNVFLRRLNARKLRPVFFPEEQPSSFLALVGLVDVKAARRALQKENVICTERGGYLRIAPHFYNTDEEMERAADLLNALA